MLADDQPATGLPLLEPVSASTSYAFNREGQRTQTASGSSSTTYAQKRERQSDLDVHPDPTTVGCTHNAGACECLC